MSKVLEAEARAWLGGKKHGPTKRDHFIVFRDGTGWTLLVKPLDGQDRIATGLTHGEVNRLRLALSDEALWGRFFPNGQPFVLESIPGPLAAGEVPVSAIDRG